MPSPMDTLTVYPGRHCSIVCSNRQVSCVRYRSMSLSSSCHMPTKLSVRQELIETIFMLKMLVLSLPYQLQLGIWSSFPSFSLLGLLVWAICHCPVYCTVHLQLVWLPGSVLVSQAPLYQAPHSQAPRGSSTFFQALYYLGRAHVLL